MTNQFQPGDRVEFYQGEQIAFKADVIKVAKNGRLWVERWFQYMGMGDPELIRQWQDARIATLVRRPK